MLAVTQMASDLLRVDAEKTAESIQSAIRDIVFDRLGRKGVVLGLSGGVDSSVVAALCVRALGSDRVHGLLMPEADSSGDSLRLGKEVAEQLRIATTLENLTPILEAFGCYHRRDEAIRSVIPEFTSEFKCKLVLPSILDDHRYAIFSVVAQSPEGTYIKRRLTSTAYLGIVAATNFKQRARKTLEYYHADRLQFAVAGTPNRLEYDQGFFVKNGDGAADLKPIAHLYKSQVYQLADYLQIPDEICTRPPTTDTYSLEQTQEEFYFGVPLQTLDLCLYGCDHDLSHAEVAEAANLSIEQVERVYGAIRSKRKANRYLHLPPVLVQDL